MTSSAAAALAAIAALHGYWALGGTWPGRDATELGELVVGPGKPLPAAPAVWGVAAALVTGAGVVAAAGAGRGGAPVRRAAQVVSGVLLARGAGGVAYELARDGRSRFGRLDLTLYSPLCLALGGAARPS